MIIGKTNIPIGLSDWQSFNRRLWRHRQHSLGPQPHAKAATLAAHAAALAAGLVPLELGSDIGGSIRVPAHYCGVFSHKPSFDLIPQRGYGPPQVTGHRGSRRSRRNRSHGAQCRGILHSN